jgi:hypothetical protein
MVQAIRQELTIQKDSVLEIHSSMLKSGEHVEVIILLKENKPMQKHSLLSLMGSGKGCFSSPDEVDTFIRGERDKWE